MSVLIADEQFEIEPASLAVRVKVYAPSLTDDEKHACVYEFSVSGTAANASERLRIFGGSPMQAVLLTFIHVADNVRDLLAKHGGHIDCAVWDDLNKLV